MEYNKETADKIWEAISKRIGTISVPIPFYKPYIRGFLLKVMVEEKEGMLRWLKGYCEKFINTIDDQPIEERLSFLSKYKWVGHIIHAVLVYCNIDTNKIYKQMESISYMGVDYVYDFIYRFIEAT